MRCSNRKTSVEHLRRSFPYTKQHRIIVRRPASDRQSPGATRATRRPWNLRGHLNQCPFHFDAFISLAERVSNHL